MEKTEAKKVLDELDIIEKSLLAQKDSLGRQKKSFEKL